MNKTIRVYTVPGSLWIAALGAVSLSSCGDDTQSNLIPPPPTTSQLGGTVNLACALGGSPASGTGASSNQGSKQQNIQFQQKPACQQQQQNNPSQQQQQLSFLDSKISDFDISVDCTQRRVVVRTMGQDKKSASLPINADGSVVGELNFLNKLENDGKGNGVCWAGYKVAFNGDVDCNSNKPGTTDKNPDFGKVSLNTEVAFNQANFTALQQAGIAGVADTSTGTGVESNPGLVTGPGNSDDQPGRLPSPTPTPSASVTASPTPTPTATSSPAPTPSASATSTPVPLPVPLPLPSSTITPIRVCLIENPCPVVGKADLNCSQ